MPVVGRARCWNPDCGEEVNVTENGNGTLSMRCDFCALSVYGVNGAPVRDAISRTMAPIKGKAAPAGDPAPGDQVPPLAGPGDPLPAPAKPKRVRSIFNPLGVA